LARFIPYDGKVHRGSFFQLNIEFLTWFVEEVQARHKIDVISTTGQTVREYAAMVLDDFTNIPSSEGILYLLELEDTVGGMGALKKLEECVGEIKRMYIRPEYRGKGYGKRLLKRLIEKGRELGYSILRLETADFSEIAHHIYRVAGFEEIEGFSGGETPEWYRSHCLFMEKKMQNMPAR
jgi:GNAT superfamily N-acetyltransferase